MNNIRAYIRNIFSIIVIFVYTFVMLFQNVPFINFIGDVSAEDAWNKTNLVWVFVDWNVYKNIKDDISWYADYIQKTNTNTKALILPIDTKSISSIDIHKNIDNLYFHWEQWETSFLKSIVLVWDVPLPVVNKDWFIYESIYPYVDLINPSFSYSEVSWYFDYNWSSSDVELTHWVIKFDKTQDYSNYFSKLKTYSQDPESFVDKKFYLDNFVSQWNSFNNNMLQYYLNKIIFAENLITKKITPLILDYFNKKNNQWYDDVVDWNWISDNIWDNSFTQPDWVFSDMLWFNSKEVKEFDSIQKEYKTKTSDYLNNMKNLLSKAKEQDNDYWQTPTLTLESSLENFFRNYIELFGNEYGWDLTDNLKATWRYDWNNTISSLNSIDIKDQISINYFQKVNNLLEQELDKKIEEEQFYMYYPMLTSYTVWDNYQNKNYVEWDWDTIYSAYNEKKTYENFYFWKNALNITWLNKTHIYKGTFWNFTWISILKNMDSRWKKSSISAMNNLFDTQTLSNRWYNNMIAKKDWDDYKNNCSKVKWDCVNLWKKTNSESIKNWAMRIYGWYSPININLDAMWLWDYDWLSNPSEISNIDSKSDVSNEVILNEPNYKKAWSPSYAPNKNWSLFDLWWTKVNKTKQNTWYTDTISSLRQYSSIFQTEYYNKISNWKYSQYDFQLEYRDWYDRLNGNYYDYFDNIDFLCNDYCSVSNNSDSIMLNDKRMYNYNYTDQDRNPILNSSWNIVWYSYPTSTLGWNFLINDITSNFKFIDTRIKHVSPWKKELDWFNMITKARPVDSENYISFLWVWWNNIKLKYPNIFDIHVYEEKDWRMVLKNKNDISKTIEDYLRSIVSNYNQKLEKELNNKNIYYNSNKKAFDKISNTRYKPHEYNLLDDNFLIDKIWEEKISNIAEMLYYINLWWKEKPIFSTLSWEVNYLYDNFNINEKLSYVVWNYLDTETEKKVWNYDLDDYDENFPWKAKKWYEAGFISSKNLDTQNLNDFNLDNTQNNLIKNNFLWWNSLPLDSSSEWKQECWRPLWEAVILWEWPSAFSCRLQETLSKPFKIWSTSACMINSDWFSSLEKILSNQPSKDKNYYDESDYEWNNKVNFNKFKDYIDNNFTVNTNKSTYNYEDFTWSIQITNYSTLNEITDSIEKIYVKSPVFTWNEFFINWNSTYIEWKWIELSWNTWKIPFSFYNKNTWEGKYYSYKAWEKLLNITFCNQSNICYTKDLIFDKSPWKLKYVDINVFSESMVYGWENPFIIKWFDSLPEEWKYQNQINWTIQNYKLSLSPSIWDIRSQIWLEWKSSIDYNFSSTNSLMSIKSNTEPLSWVDNFDVKLEIDDNWKSLNNNLMPSSLENIKIINKDNLLDSEIKISDSNYQLPNDPYSLITWDSNYKTYDKSKLLKLNINPKVYDKTLKTPLNINDKNWQFIPWTFVETTKVVNWKEITYEKFIEQKEFLITKNSWVDIYLLPTYKTWPYNIDINIPWINTYTIDWNIDNFPIKDVYIALDKYQAQKNEEVFWKIFGVDQFWNLQENIDWVDITSSSWISFDVSWNDISITWEKSWFLKINIDWSETTVNFGVNETFIPLDKKISVMYLTLFGYDWWKYASSIMSNSSKNLAITTTSQDPKNVNNYDYIIRKDLKTNRVLELILDEDKTIFNLWNLQVNYTWNIFDTTIEEKDNFDDINSNWIFYVKEQTDDIITSNYIADWGLYINNDRVIDFSNNTQSSNIQILSDPNYKYWVYNVFLKEKKVGSLVINNDVLNFDKLSSTQPIVTNIIPWDASSNGIKAFWIQLQDSEYKPISQATKIDVIEDKWLWFRSNYRNITDFAAWLDVWNSSKSFQNEFMINYWDPFIKRISSQEVIPEVSMSKTYGYRVHSDIAWWIKNVTPIDFNNDGLKDIAILYKNWNIRFLKNYKWEDSFEDLWNLMVLWKSVDDMFSWDYDGDWYKDIFIKFTDGTTRVYKNNSWEFSADPYPICVNVSWSSWINFQTDQIFFKDMNNDNKTDIVVNDLSSNVKVFYWPSYVSDSITDCSWINLEEKLVKSYSYTVDKEDKFMDDGYIYWEWFSSESNLMQSDMRNAFSNWDLRGMSRTWATDPTDYVDSIWPSNNRKVSTQDIPKVLWPSYVDFSEDTIPFKKATFLTWSDPLDIYKTMEDLNWWNLMPWDKVKITLNVNNKENKKITYLESLKWPFAVISKNDRPILEFENIPSSKVRIPLKYPNFMFQVDDYNKSFSISYKAYFKWSSSISIKVDDFTENSYWDIKVFMKNWCIKWYDYFKWSWWSPMVFQEEYIDLSSKLKEKTNDLDNSNKVQDIIWDVKNIRSQWEDWNYQWLLEQFNFIGSDIWEWNETLESVVGNNWSINLDASIWPDVWAIKSKVSWILDWLCSGFGFWKSDCWWIPVPCNYAFLAPWMINACWCPVWIDPGLPVLNLLWTMWSWPVPVPVPNWLMASPSDWFLWSPWGVYPSFFRMYVAPTLTGWVWLWICFWDYSSGMWSTPPPMWAISWNCIVVAWTLPWSTCSASANNDADSRLDDWMHDLDNGICSSLPNKTWLYSSSSVSIPNGSSFQNSNISPSVWDTTWLNGLVNFEMNAHKINSLEDARTLMKWWVPFTLNIETWTFNWLIQCIVKKWMNKQIQFFISQLTQMTIYVTYPDMDWLFNWFKEKDWSNFDFEWTNFSKVLDDFAIWKESDSADSDFQKTASKYLPSKQGLKTLWDELANPFNSVKEYFNDVPLINATLKTAVIKVPWIWKDELDKQITYLENWIERQKEIIKEWEAYIDGFDWSCEWDKACEKAYDSILKVEKFIKSVQKNIEILNQYKDLPLKLHKYMNLVDYYLQEIACIINKYVDMIVWWLNRNSKIFEKWVDTIITLINIIKTWQLIIDISLEWKTTCWKCRADAWDLYDCVLSLLCIDLPVLPIPPFKIPDIFIDFSHINLWVDVILPKIKVYPVPIGVFTLPDLPSPAVSIELPELPLLPAPPELPDLPSLPPMPTLELPNLPPPPKIPELLPSIKAVLEVFKIVWYFRCIIKNGIWLVAEWNVKTRIEQLTARTNRVFPFDFLNIDFPVLPFAWFDVRIDAYVNFRLELSQVYDQVRSITDSINKKTWQSIGDMLEFDLQLQDNIDWIQNNIDDNFNIDSDSFQLELDENSFVLPKQKKLFAQTNFNKLIVNNKPIDSKIAKWILFDELSFLLSQKQKDYMNSISSIIYERAKKLQKDSLHKAKVTANTEWVYDIQSKFEKLFQEHQKNNAQIVKAIKDMEKWEKVDFDNDIFYKTWSSNLVNSNIKEKEENITYSTDLFNIDEKSKSIIKNSQVPEVSYLQMYWKSLAKFDQKVEKYKNWKQNWHYKYQELQNKANSSLNIIENTLWEEIAYSSDDNNWNAEKSVDIIADPSQNIKWLYMKWSDNVYYNVINNKEKASEIREKNTYKIEDMNNDNIDDIIWYDQNNVYIKYSKDKPSKTWIINTKKYIYDNIINDFESITDNNWFIQVNGSKFKIWDSNTSINNLNLEHSNAQKLRLWWKHNNMNSYTIFYSSRIDILNDIETYYNYSSNFNYAWNNFKKHALIVYDERLWNINELKSSNINIKWVHTKTFIPMDLSSKENVSVILDKSKLKLDNKWKYFKVYKSNLNIELNNLELLSSYSNQEVWAEQLIWDKTSPYLTSVLERSNIPENEIGSNIVWTWTKLNWFINTNYTIKWSWDDNIWIKNKWIADEDYNFIKSWNKINIWSFEEPTTKVYYFVWEDYNNNTERVKISVNIWIPDISLDSINKESWTLFSSIDSDMDETAIKYGIQTENGIKIIDNLNGNNLFTGWVYDTSFEWSVFDNAKKIIFYNDIQNEIWSLNLSNWEIKLSKPDLNLIWTVSSWKIIYNIYNQENKKIFSINLPIKEQVQSPIMHTTDKFMIRELDNSKLWIFDNGYCVYNKQDNICWVYISENWLTYITKSYQQEFIVDYNINEIWVISSTFYNTSIPDKSLLKEDNKIFTIFYKAKNMSK